MARKLKTVQPVRFTNRRATRAVRPNQLVVMAMLAVGVALCSPASKPASPDAAETEVLAAEKARTTALDSSDVPALEKLLADDLTYVHASGKVDSKASFLRAIRSGELHYISWEARKLNVRVMGDVAILDGEYKVRVTDRRVKPDPFDINIFILSAYAKRSGRWQQVAWQSTRDVALSPPGKP